MSDNRQKMFTDFPSIDVRLDNFAVRDKIRRRRRRRSQATTLNWKGVEREVKGKSRNLMILSKVGSQWPVGGEKKHIQEFSYQPASDQA